tara:strand:- start:53022 stop:53477 length:456 start_codon:yes stop_codon:yes gene_type:complete
MVQRTLMILFIFLISCSSDDDLSKENTEFVKAIEKWQSFGYENYMITERISCYCYGVLVKDVFVQNGVKEKVEFDESMLPEGQTYEDVFNHSKTIEDAFLFIDNLLKQNPDGLTIEYDAEYGFPTVISIDYNFNMVDDEVAYLYNNFVILN